MAVFSETLTAWRANQPKPVFAEVEKEADEDEAER